MLIPSIDLMGGRIVQLVQGEKLRLAFDDRHLPTRLRQAQGSGQPERPTAQPRAAAFRRAQPPLA